MTSSGPAFQECTGSCYENVPAQKAVSSDLWSTIYNDIKWIFFEKLPWPMWLGERCGLKAELALCGLCNWAGWCRRWSCWTLDNPGWCRSLGDNGSAFTRTPKRKHYLISSNCKSWTMVPQGPALSRNVHCSTNPSPTWSCSVTMWPL